MSVTGVRGAEWRIEMKTRILTDRWRKMFRRRRRMRDPLLVFNMSIFNFDDRWNRIFTQFKIHENGT
ncbi:MAG: hypothetical protein DME47_00130 [Verrucomicrobia bacterium]|nr:MAG: hypothetical protein DME47_00130 [Verrucomicrobiota bacterium]